MRRTTIFAILLVFVITPAFAQKKKSKQRETATETKQGAQEASAAAAPAGQQDDEENKGPWKALNYRLVGPYRGGRVLAVSGVVGQDNTYYFGGVAGGVWKTTDGGLNWKAMFDKQKDASPSIGALAVSESDPNVIYVGTGEACIRGNIVGGNGVYKSIDAGKTWKFVGLPDSHAIGRLIVNPKNPDIAFVAALGHPFGDNEERGVFRTRDGGKTWKEIKAHGLPETVLGRIGVTVSGANPNRVWAVVEAEKGGIYRSDDGGENWQLLTDDHRFRQRAWYYSHIFADPKSADTVYILNTGVYRSNDGGKTFNVLRVPHGDNHGLWIDPTNPKRLINGNDGGATISTDGAQSWTSVFNQPSSLFYHATTENRFPYYIYGAQQDNSTVGIASASPDGAIDRPDWHDVGGGESGYIAPDPTDPEIVYAGSYGGEITRYDHHTGETQSVNPWPVNPIGWAAADVKHRFQWTEPIVFSPHDAKTLYFAGEVLFKTTDAGMSWSIISPDLTRNDKQKQQASGS